MAEHDGLRSEEHTSELQSLRHLVCRLLLEKKKRVILRKPQTVTRAWHDRACSGHLRSDYGALGRSPRKRSARAVASCHAPLVVFFLIIRRPPRSTLFPSPTLFRSARIRAEERADMAARVHDSVLQTLALIQRSADQPQEVAKLARAQERELRS